MGGRPSHSSCHQRSTPANSTALEGTKQPTTRPKRKGRSQDLLNRISHNTVLPLASPPARHYRPALLRKAIANYSTRLSVNTTTLAYASETSSGRPSQRRTPSNQNNRVLPEERRFPSNQNNRSFLATSRPDQPRHCDTNEHKPQPPRHKADNQTSTAPPTAYHGTKHDYQVLPQCQTAGPDSRNYSRNLHPNPSHLMTPGSGTYSFPACVI